MTIASNLYAEKIFGEHPVALWALDDKVHYLSLLSETEKDFVGWTLSGLTKNTEEPTDYPMLEESISSFTSANNVSTSTLTKNISLSSENLDSSIGTISTSFYFYTDDQAISSVNIGYTDGTTPVYQTYQIGSANTFSWIFLSTTLLLPSSNTNIQPYISLTYSSQDSHTFYINGISFAQNSEQFATEDTGSIVSALPTDISVTGDAAISFAYGLQDSNAYYLSDGYKMFAYNAGVPMVYGASNVTKIIPADGPSIIFPGKGFLNEGGKNKEYTAEFWLRVFSKTTKQKRIFGPIASTDGLYVDGPFLVLKIGNEYFKHLVKEWERPMLIDIRYSPNAASLLINGEAVISIELDEKTFPSRYNNDNKDQDFLAFYAYEDVPLLEIDCVAIYTYLIPDIVAKRRFAYGQAVDLPENTNTGYNGYDIFVDYKYANYSNSYSYPDLARWSNGIANNLDVFESYISVPKYSLPSLITSSGYDISKFTTDVENINGSEDFFISLKPTNDWDGTYLGFDSANFLNDGTSGFYGIFKATGSVASQTLFVFYNKITADYLHVKLKNSATIEYWLKYGNSDEVLVFEQDGAVVNQKFVAGISLPKLFATSKPEYANLKTFFYNISALEVFVGGSKLYQSQFLGKIHMIAFCDRNNIEKITAFFDEDGFMVNSEFGVFNAFLTTPLTYDGGDEDGGSDSYTNTLDGGAYNTFTSDTIYSHTPSYGLIASKYLGEFELNIVSYSYWQDYIPLKYFAKLVNVSATKQEYALNYLQFNLDYPILNKMLDEKYDLRDAVVRSYVSFNYVNAGAYQSTANISYTELLNKNRVVIPETNSELSNYWENTRYEVTSDTIIYPPGNVDFNLLNIVLHLEIVSADSQDANITLSSLQLLANAFNQNDTTPIGTRFGNDIHISAKNGLYQSYTETVPVSITNQSFPYLYLSTNSGIGIKDMGSDGIERSLKIFVNPSSQEFYSVAAIQMFYKYNSEIFPLFAEKIFSVEAIAVDGNENIDFYIVAANESQTIGKIFAINADTDEEYLNANFFVNGVLVKYPYISPNSWDILGLQFSVPVKFGGSSRGNISVFKNSFVNNISYYQITKTQESSDTILRRISQVPFMLDKGGSQTLWGDFLEGATEYDYEVPISWATILYVPTEKKQFISPADIYKSYVGTNKFIVSSETELLFNGYKYTAYKDISWQTNIVTPV